MKKAKTLRLVEFGFKIEARANYDEASDKNIWSLNLNYNKRAQILERFCNGVDCKDDSDAFLENELVHQLLSFKGNSPYDQPTAYR
tara:strand:- start:104 stop:361 length:258 start_codon:yes stop_codon:yes gene_type:complete